MSLKSCTQHFSDSIFFLKIPMQIILDFIRHLFQPLSKKWLVFFCSLCFESGRFEWIKIILNYRFTILYLKTITVAQISCLRKQAGAVLCAARADGKVPMPCS